MFKTDVNCEYNCLVNQILDDDENSRVTFAKECVVVNKEDLEGIRNWFYKNFQLHNSLFVDRT